MYSLVASAINHPDAVTPYVGLFNHRIIRALSETSVDLEAVSPRPFAPPVGPYSAYASLPDTEKWDGYTVHHPRFWYLLPKRLLYALSGDSYARRVPAYLERTLDPPDVVHACHIYPDGYGMLPYARDHDLPLFVVAHGTLLNDFDDHAPGVATRIRRTLEAAEGVLCVSDALAERARSLTDDSKVRTVPIGADPKKFSTDDRTDIWKDLGISPDESLVLFVGEFSERKGIPELTTLLSARAYPDATFAFVGRGGALEADLRRSVGDWTENNGCVEAGVPSDRLQEWFVAADLLVLPSHAEGRPTVIYEAMASETAVLATDVGGVPEQVVDGETGRLVPPGDVEALGDALAALTGDPDRLRAMGEAGRARLEARNWTWEGHARRIRKLHREAIR